MDRNIYYSSLTDKSSQTTSTNKGLVAWNSESGHSTNAYGPVTVMNYLYNATKDWDNIPNIIMDYADEGNNGSYGYGDIVTTNGVTKITKKDGTAVTVLTDKEGYTNLKARMPYYSEVHGDGKCLTYAENGNQYGSCPLWLVNYLSSISNYSTSNGKIEISGINGYWLFSSFDLSSKHSWYVSNYGVLGTCNVGNAQYNGVRPVITLKL